MIDLDIQKTRNVLHYCGLKAEQLVEDFDRLTPSQVRDQLQTIARQCEIAATDFCTPSH